MLFPEIPADLAALTSTELRALARQIKAAATKVLSDGSMSVADVAVHLTQRAELISLAEAKEAAATLEADTSDDEPVAPVAPVVEEETVVEEAEEKELATVGAPKTTPAVVPTTFGSPSAPPPAPPAARRGSRLTPERLLATDGVPGKAVGEGFADWRELALAAVDRSASVRSNTAEKFEVARLMAKYDPSRILTDDVNFNMSRFEPDELMAALCAPATPYYDLACMNTLRRPVFNSLPQFQAPRGKVSIQSSPQLSDITNGLGVWTAANEASTNAVKAACQTITCGSTTEYQIYGVYRCLTVRNLLAMTYPELVEAWLNRLGAAHARLAEQQLLNAMGTAATTINGQALGYGATQSITTTILNYIALYQETQRWDITDNFEAWMPRFVQYGIRMDLARRRRHDGGYLNIPSEAEVDAIFRDAGVNPHWFIDSPTWATPLPALAVANNLSRLPANVQILLAPPGKLAVMDRGELAIGVTGNGIYRDNNSNARNEFTFFFENFEGIVNTTSCPAHIIDVPVCWSGVQIDDIVINCQGGDELGYQS